MNILVTGGAGFIGSHTVVELVDAGYRPIIVDNFSNSEKSVVERLKEITKQEIATYDHDYQDSEFLRDIIEQEKIDGVIHFAAFKAVGESVQEPIKYYENNVVGFVELLKFLEDKKVKNLVFSSSATVYGEADEVPVREDAPFKPAASPYGSTKQMCEIILRDAASVSTSISAIAFRDFNPIGAHESGKIGELPVGIPSNLIPFVTQTAAGIRDKLTVFGNDYDTPDGSCIRDYIHVVDLAKAHVAALNHLDKQKPSYFDAFNVGTGKGNSVLEVLNTFEAVTGQKVPHEIGPRRPGDVVVSCGAVDKAQQILGWKSERDLATALKDAWNWQQQLSKSKS